MAEWLKAHDSKSCGPKGLGGSNPLASARKRYNKKCPEGHFFIVALPEVGRGFSYPASSARKSKLFLILLLGCVLSLPPGSFGKWSLWGFFGFMPFRTSLLN